MLDGIGKDISLSLAVFPGVLLTAKHDGLSAIDFVDAVDDCIQTLHLLELLGIEVELFKPIFADYMFFFSVALLSDAGNRSC